MLGRIILWCVVSRGIRYISWFLAIAAGQLRWCCSWRRVHLLEHLCFQTCPNAKWFQGYKLLSVVFYCGLWWTELHILPNNIRTSQGRIIILMSGWMHSSDWRHVRACAMQVLREALAKMKRFFLPCKMALVLILKHECLIRHQCLWGTYSLRFLM